MPQEGGKEAPARPNLSSKRPTVVVPDPVKTPSSLSGSKWNRTCAVLPRAAFEPTTSCRRDPTASAKCWRTVELCSSLGRREPPLKSREAVPAVASHCGLLLPAPVTRGHHGVAHPQVEAGSKRHWAEPKTQAWTSSGGDQGPHGGLRGRQWGHRWRAACLQHRWEEDRCQKRIQNGGGLFWKVVRFLTKSRHTFDN